MLSLVIASIGACPKKQTAVSKHHGRALAGMTNEVARRINALANDVDLLGGGRERGAR
jgi:hypothetical protein